MRASCLAPVLLSAGGFLAGCEEGARHEDHDHEHRAVEAAKVQEATARGVLTIDPEMMRDLRLTVAPAEARPGGEGVVVLGELRVNEDAYGEVGSPVPARIARVIAAPGEAVGQGQALAELRSPELGKARADSISAKARLDLARKTLERKRDLSKDQIAAHRELQEAEAEFSSAEASLRAATAALSALGVPEAEHEAREGGLIVLRSPVAGTVIERRTALGRMVRPEDVLFRVADQSRLWLVVHAFERDAVRVKVGSKPRVTFAALPGSNFSGIVTLVGQEVEVGSRTVPIRIEIENADGRLRPGMSATAWLQVGGEGDMVVTVPAASLQRVPEGWCVFVPRDERTFEMRVVGRGRDLGGEVEVLSELRAGEKVVVEGAFLLKAEAYKSRGEGEHHDH